MDIDASKTQETRTCYNCGKPGHLHYNCKEPKKQRIQASKKEQTEEGATIAATLAQIAAQLAKMEANWGPKKEEPKNNEGKDF